MLMSCARGQITKEGKTTLKAGSNQNTPAVDLVEMTGGETPLKYGKPPRSPNTTIQGQRQKGKRECQNEQGGKRKNFFDTNRPSEQVAWVWGKGKSELSEEAKDRGERLRRVSGSRKKEGGWG